MSKVCSLTLEQGSEEVILRYSDQVSPEDKLIIQRTLKNASPDLRALRDCIEASGQKIFYDKECDETVNKPKSECDCSENSTDLSFFCNLFKSRRAYTKKELQCFIDVIQAKLDDDLAKYTVYYGCEKCNRKKSEYFIVPVIIPTDSTSSSVTLLFCPCDEPVSRSKSSERCVSRDEPIVFRHFNELTSPAKEPPEAFTLDYVGKSEEIGKWGAFLNMVDRVLRQSDLRLYHMRMRNDINATNSSCHSTLSKSQPSVIDDYSHCDHVCVVPLRRDNFTLVERFKDLEDLGFATFCRNLMRWSNCVTKRWNCVTKYPHVVLHLPSMSYPCKFRVIAEEPYASLQNIQIGRIGWLVNQFATVVYVCPGRSDYQTKCILQSFVRNARPDIDQSRLWIIENDDECLCNDIEEEYRSGCESLFYTPKFYQRVRHLTAGRQGFIIPGILSKTDVLVACELRTSLIGPCLKFQERLLNKHYVMSLLAEANIRHPPFVGVRNFIEICESLSEIVELMPSSWPRKWLLKVNCGFCGNQTALICLDGCCLCFNSKEELALHLADLLPQKLQVTKAYMNVDDFFEELEQHGGVLMPCAPDSTRSVSLGCFIEHDTSEARIRVAADVLQTRGCSKDLGYIIPQTTLPAETINSIVKSVGQALLTEQCIGFFGIDVVVFSDCCSPKHELDYWVVDIDPYYTDLISFDDWRRFCLDSPNSQSFSENLFSPADGGDNRKRASLFDQGDRFVVCSGKLYTDGLSHCSGNSLVELLDRQHLAYSPKARTGCMICPIDNDSTTFLLFSFCRGRQLALERFIEALYALRSAATSCKRKFTKRPPVSNLNSLIRDLEKSYDINVSASRR